MTSSNEKHSEHFFTDARNFWWNPDFLHLMANRWNLTKVRSVLDVGCGVGHWSAAMLGILPQEAKLIGVDREPEWVKKASKRFQTHSDRISFVEGSAERLPFPDATFDMVTCQTLLIHVADPTSVIKEMLRILKPGGLIAVAEPSNLAYTRTSIQTTIQEEMALFRLHLMTERGKIALNEGNNSLGDLIPGLFASIGISDIQVYQSDRAAAIYPPYTDAGQPEAIEDELRDADTDYWMFGRKQTKRYFIAAGGTSEEFDDLYSLALTHQARIKKAINEKTFHCGRGCVMYLVSGRKGK